MNKKIVICLMAAVMLFAEKKNVAVLDFKAKSLPESDASMVSDFFRSDLVSTKTFTVLDRNNMQKVMKEQAFQQSGCTSSDCAVQVGRLLNMQYMFIGTLSKFGDNYVLSVDMINVETGAIDDSGKDYSPDINKMLEVTKKLARKFAATVGSVAQPETQQQRIRVNKKRSSSLSVSGSSPSDNGSKVIRALLFTAGMGTLAGSGICFGLAAKAWDTHKTTDDFLEAEDAYNRTQTLDTVKVILGASGGTLLTGWLIAKLSSRKTATALRRVPMDRLTLTLAGQKIGINYRQRF